MEIASSFLVIPQRMVSTQEVKHIKGEVQELNNASQYLDS